MCLTHKKGVSSLQLSRDINVTQKTAWHMLHRIRKLLTDIAQEKIEGLVECDETFVGGKNKNRHRDKKVENSQGRSFRDMGMLSNGKVRCMVMDDTKRSSVHPAILDNVKEGSLIVTDEWHGYEGLESKYNREVVDHSRGQYLNANSFTTNSIEGFWGILKCGLIGIYNRVSKKHLQKYSEEFVYRYNTRTPTSPEKFNKALSNYALVRLPYKQLIA